MAAIQRVWNAKSNTKVFDIDMKQLYQDLDVRSYISSNPYIVDGIKLSATGLSVTMTSGEARGRNCFVPFLNNNLGSTISTHFRVTTSLTTSIPPLSTGYVILEYNINSTNPSDNYFVPSFNLKFVTSLSSPYPAGSVCEELLLAKITSDTSNAYLSYDDDCVKNIFELLSSEKSSLSAYIVSSADGYISSGVLIVRTDAIPGEGCLLLGDDGNLYNLENPILTPNQPYYKNLNFYNVTTLMNPSLYPEDGLLITKSTPVDGYAGLLLGTSGATYSFPIIVSSLPSTTASLNLQDIVISGTSPSIGGSASGTRFTPDPSTIGNSSLILGVDGNTYSQPI